MNEDKILLKDVLESAGRQLRSEFEEIKANNPHAAEGGAEAEIILRTFLKERLPPGMNQNLWLSSVLPISEEEFIRYSESISNEIIAKRDSEDDNPPPVKIE